MTKCLKRSLCLLLSVLIVISVFAAFPLTAGAAADTSEAWIFAANDGRTYDLDGKWVRFGDEDFQLEGTGEFTLTNRTTYIYQLKYGATHIADSRNTQAGAIHIGDTFYVTGQGTEDHPYIFTPNLIFYDDTVTTFGKGATVALGYENLEATASGNNGVAVPGDGFKSYARMQVGASNYVHYIQHPEQNHQPYSTVNGYIGVKNSSYGSYNGSNNFVSGSSFPFSDVNDTLYYLGGEDYNNSRLYTFSENINKRTSFDGTNKVICTVVWENQDGTKLKTMTYNFGDTADDGGLSPSKAADAAYTYSFTGFEPAYEALTDDMTYVATYDATPKGELTYKVNSWIFPVDDGAVYNGDDDLEHKCYRYGGEIGTFPEGGGSFSVVNDQIRLCDLVVADIDTSHPEYKNFAGTVYVYGKGTQDEPFIFNPNYIYGYSTKTMVKDGPAIAVDNAHKADSDKGVANPGDGFKAMSRIRVGNAQVQFLQQLGYYSASRNLLGVGETTYGYRYSKKKALPFNFVSEDHTLYYFEKSESGIYQFSETSPPLKRSFKPSDSTIHTITWKNYDNTVLDTETYYVNDTPVYKGETPVKQKDSEWYYKFSGWSPAVSAVTDDTEYVAQFSQQSRLFKGHSLSLKGDIGVNFFLDPGQVSASNTEVVFTYYGNTVTSSVVLDSNTTYYKATCKVAAAEMACNIHAVVYINGVAQDETDDYSAREYGMVIINDPSRSADLVTLAKEMLNYGAQAQLVFNVMTDDLANKYVEDYAMADVTADMISEVIPDKSDMRANIGKYGLQYIGTSVVYLSETSLRHYYKVVDTDTFDQYKDGVSGFTYGEKATTIYFEKKDISAQRLDETQTFTIGSDSYNFTALDYAKLVLSSDATNTNEKNLAKATYLYNRAADVYFSNHNNNN